MEWLAGVVCFSGKIHEYDMSGWQKKYISLARHMDMT